MKKKNKSENIWKTLSAVIFALVVVAEGFLFFEIWNLQLLPGKYLLIILAVLVVVDILIALLMKQPKRGKWQKQAGHKRKVIAAIVSFVLIVGCLLGTLVVSQVGNTLKAITDTTVTTALMNVYVLSEDPAGSIEDAKDYTFGITAATDEESNQSAISMIEDQLGSDVTVKSYESVAELIDALYAGEVDAIILDEAFVSVIPNMEGYEDFTEKVRLITEHVVEKTEKPTAPAKTSQNNSGTKTVDVTTTPFLLYISGNDSRLEELADGGSDVNILVAVNPVDHQVLMINTPRDYYIVNPASGNGSRDKLSHCGLGGIENCVEAMTGLYGYEIDYYARINFSGFRTLIDALGGVTVYSENSFFVSHGSFSVQTGENYLTGAQALGFVRERKNLPGGDNDRGKNQMALIKGLINQLSADNIISNYADILESLEGMFATTMSTKDIGKLVDMQLSEMPSWDVLTFAVTGENGNDRCWAVGNGYGYVMYPHEYMVEHASDLIGRVLDGEVLTEDDLVVAAP